MAAFSTDGAATIQRKVDVLKETSNSVSWEDWAEIYEIERCVKWIQDNKFEKVALQFPDSMLCDSSRVVHSLQERTGADACVLADTSYGSCCIDEVAAEHYCADCILHYGHSCLSPTQRLPVLYVFGRQQLDVQHCCQVLKDMISDLQTKLLVLYDVVYHHVIDDLEREISRHYTDVAFSRLLIPSGFPVQGDSSSSTEASQSSCTTRSNVKFGRCLKLPADRNVEDCTMVYIGPEGATLTNFMMLYNQCQFYTYDPLTRKGRKESVNVNKLLMKRYYLIEKAKDANIVGILVGTLGVSDYLQSIARVKSVIKMAGKKSYTFVVGKLNVAKLANFAEVDIFVLVACSENSLLDSSEFYKPVVTPFEMEMACNQSREWTGGFVADFRDLLPGGGCHVEVPGDQEVKRDMSLITGGMRSIGVDKELADVTDQAQGEPRMTIANIDAHSAGSFLRDRLWQGLDPQLGRTTVSTAVEGAKGTATSYVHEPT